LQSPANNPEKAVDVEISIDILEKAAEIIRVWK